MKKYPISLHTRELALGCALLLAILADLLLRTDGRPGINVTLWALAGSGTLWLLSKRRDVPVSRESWALVGGAVMFAALLILRDAEALAVLCLLSAIVLLGLAAGRSALAWAKRTNFVELIASAVRVGVLIVLGPLGWSIGAARQPAVPSTVGRVILRGTIMALPPLLILTALLTSADPVFERLLFSGLEPLLEHLLYIGVLTWLTSGFLRAFLIADTEMMERIRLPRPKLATSEIAVALSLLNVLLIAFLVVQVRYLFGGSGLVEVTPGLSYAEYARRGFFELVAATVLVVPVLLIADWAAAEDDTRGRRALRATSTLLVLLLVGVLASAAYRMKLYQDAYGLTEDRLYGSAFMVWLTFVLAWVTVTVQRGRRRNFAFGAIIGGLAVIAILHVLNPHALIARVNIARAATGAEYDGKYLGTLSADAVPTLFASLNSLPPRERCDVLAVIDKKWSGERRGGWRTWNMADARARRLVAASSTPAYCRDLKSPRIS